MWRDRQTGRANACVSLLCVLVLGAGASNAAAQQEVAPAVSEAPPATPETQPANGLEVAAASPQDEKVDSERRRKLRVALLTGGLIAITGLALVLLTILGGSATRRGLRRKPLKEGPLPLEPIPAERFDEPELDSAAPNDGEDPPAKDGGAR